jgi:hypothetical protein
MELIERHCNGCNTTKPISEFGKDKYRAQGYSFRCKSCRNLVFKEYRENNLEKIKESNNKSRERRKAFYGSEKGILSSRKAHLKRMYGITIEQYNEMSEVQDHKCMICGGTEMNYKNKVLCVDHNHTTGQVRGLLCGLCNSGIGKFKEDKQLLMNTIKYLEKYESPSSR